MSQYKDLEDEKDAKEAYPFLYGDTSDPWEPPGYELTPEQEKFRQTERAKLLEKMRVVEEHGENYHYIEEITYEMLPTVNFRRYVNLFLAKPTSAFLRSVPRRSNT